MHLWDKGGTVRDSLISFTCDSDRVYDARLAPYDIVGSMAHAVMLERCGLITAGEMESLLAGLARLLEETAQSDFSIGKEYEDIHSWVEIRLGEMVAGEAKMYADGKEKQIAAEAAGRPATFDPGNQIASAAAGKLHTGRSRNDQVLTDLHLFIRHRTFLLAHDLDDELVLHLLVPFGVGEALVGEGFQERGPVAPELVVDDGIDVVLDGAVAGLVSVADPVKETTPAALKALA